MCEWRKVRAREFELRLKLRSCSCLRASRQKKEAAGSTEWHASTSLFLAIHWTRLWFWQLHSAHTYNRMTVRRERREETQTRQAKQKQVPLLSKVSFALPLIHTSLSLSLKLFRLHSYAIEALCVSWTFRHIKRVSVLFSLFTITSPLTFSPHLFWPSSAGKTCFANLIDWTSHTVGPSIKGQKKCQLDSRLILD